MRRPSRVLLLGLVWPVLLAAQVKSVPPPGIELRAEVIATPAWTLEQRTGSLLDRRATYGPGPVAGIRAGMNPIVHLNLFGAAQWNGRGLRDGSGFTVVEAGLEGRLPVGIPLVPRVNVTAGRVAESGGVWFSFWSAGAGADWYLARRLALGLEVRRLDPLSTGSDRGATATTVRADMTRLHLSVAIPIPVWSAP